MLPKNAEVVVIGGGLIGSSVTYYLAKRKVQVVQLEKQGLACFTSSSCDGMVALQTKKPGIHLVLALESLKRYKQLMKDLNDDIEFKANGMMLVIKTEDELKAMKSFVEEQRKIGLDVALLDRNQTIEKEPIVSKDIIGATHSDMDAQVHPMYLVFALTNTAKHLGARICTHTEVKGIRMKSNRVTAVQTSRGEIETDIVVNATGVYAPVIGKMVGLDIPIKPRRGQVLVTEPMPKRINGSIISANTIAVKFGTPSAQNDEVGVGVEQTENGNILIGATRELVGFNNKVTWQGIHSIARSIIDLLPDLKNIKIIRMYAGLRPYTPDGLPILGRVDNLEGFIMAAGHEGDGVCLSPITGDLIAELICEKETTIPLDAFKLERFDSIE